MISKLSLCREMQDNSWYIKYKGGKMWTTFSSSGDTFLYPFPHSHSPATVGKKCIAFLELTQVKKLIHMDLFYMNHCHAKVFSSPGPDHNLFYFLWAKQLRWVLEPFLIGNKKRENKLWAHMDQFIWNCSMCLQHVATLCDITYWFMKGRFRIVSWLKMAADWSQGLVEFLFF